MMTRLWRAGRRRVALARTCTQSKPRHTITTIRNRLLCPLDSLAQITKTAAEIRKALP